MATYTKVVKAGDNLSTLGSSVGLSYADSLKYATGYRSGNPNLIYAGETITFNVPDKPAAIAPPVAPPVTTYTPPTPAPGTGIAYTPPAGYVPPNVNRDNLGSVINSDQGNIQTQNQQQQAPPVRYEKPADVVTAPKPVTPNFEAQYAALREKEGVADLEERLNQLEADEQTLQATKRQRKAGEEGKPVAMNVIEGRVNEVERQENERIDAVNREKDYVTNQLKTKYSVIDTIMKLKGVDYDNAVKDYDTTFSQTLQVLNYGKTVDAALQSTTDRAADNARANAQIVINTMTDRGSTYAELSTAEKTNLQRLGTQAGLGADFFSTVLSTSAGKPILTTIVSDDKRTATVVYKDGTTKMINTGITSAASNPILSKDQVQALNAVGVTSDIATKIAAAVLAGASLDQIREALKTDKLDPRILDTFDRVVGIQTLLKTPKTDD